MTRVWPDPEREELLERGIIEDYADDGWVQIHGEWEKCPKSGPCSTTHTKDSLNVIETE